MEIDKDKLNILINLLLYNIGWTACVLGGNLTAGVITLQVLVLHLLIVADDLNEAYLITQISLIGMLADILLFSNNILVHPSGSFIPPFWMLCLWPVFATLFRHGLAMLKGKLPLTSAFGAVTGTAVYWVGTQLSEISLGVSTPVALICFALMWGTLMPLFVAIAWHERAPSFKFR